MVALDFAVYATKILACLGTCIVHLTWLDGSLDIERMGHVDR